MSRSANMGKGILPKDREKRRRAEARRRLVKEDDPGLDGKGGYGPFADRMEFLESFVDLAIQCRMLGLMDDEPPSPTEIAMVDEYMTAVHGPDWRSRSRSRSRRGRGRGRAVKPVPSGAIPAVFFLFFFGAPYPAAARGMDACGGFCGSGGGGSDEA